MIFPGNLDVVVFVLLAGCDLFLPYGASELSGQCDAPSLVQTKESDVPVHGRHALEGILGETAQQEYLGSVAASCERARSRLSVSVSHLC